MEDSGRCRREDGHPGPETPLLLVHINGADSLNDIWGKMEVAEVQNVNAGLKHSMVKACQKVRGDRASRLVREDVETSSLCVVFTVWKLSEAL